LKYQDAGITDPIFQRSLKSAIMRPELSEKEAQIIRLIAWEYTSEEIGKKLYLSTETIRSYRKNLFCKLDVKNVAGLVRRAFEYNIIQVG
jgi:DNA-binding CsgD family transcriptional regulator